MNRNLHVLVGLAGSLSLAFAAGCGDDTSDGNGGGSAGGNAPVGGEAEGGSAPTGGAPEGGGSAAATCASYCATITGACTGANQQWPNAPACEEACAAFAQGSPGDTSMDTLECRAYHAGVAAMPTEPEVHCVHAGPLGSGMEAGNGCGTDRCSAFCRIAQEVCGAEATYSFDSEDDCRTQCADYTDNVDFNVGVMSGDTLACRMYHLTAALGDPGLHCGHLSGSQCAP